MQTKKITIPIAIISSPHLCVCKNTAFLIVRLLGLTKLLNGPIP
jgi:hypothetical protein